MTSLRDIIKRLVQAERAIKYLLDSQFVVWCDVCKEYHDMHRCRDCCKSSPKYCKRCAEIAKTCD